MIRDLLSACSRGDGDARYSAYRHVDAGDQPTEIRLPPGKWEVTTTMPVQEQCVVDLQHGDTFDLSSLPLPALSCHALTFELVQQPARLQDPNNGAMSA